MKDISTPEMATAGGSRLFIRDNQPVPLERDIP
jgi:hypothetical protein